MTVDVTSVNDAPVGCGQDGVDERGHGAHVRGGRLRVHATPTTRRRTPCRGQGTTLPAAGSLTAHGVAVAAGDFVAAADIAAGKLKFTPAANANGAGYASFNFHVQDNGGTANGGVDTPTRPTRSPSTRLGQRRAELHEGREPDGARGRGCAERLELGDGDQRRAGGRERARR